MRISAPWRRGVGSIAVAGRSSATAAVASLRPSTRLERIANSVERRDQLRRHFTTHALAAACHSSVVDACGKSRVRAHFVASMQQPMPLATVRCRRRKWPEGQGEHAGLGQRDAGAQDYFGRFDVWSKEVSSTCRLQEARRDVKPLALDVLRQEAATKHKAEFDDSAEGGGAARGPRARQIW